MIPEAWLIWSIPVVVVGFAALLIARRREYTRSRGTDYYGNTEAYVGYDEETASSLHAWAEEARRDRMAREDSGLYDTRTLAELATECPACGGDHPGTCAAWDSWEADLTNPSLWDNTILTGKIVDEIPADEPVTAGVAVRTDPFSELFREWHTDADGNWVAPLMLTDSLDADDWLRELLVAA